MKAKITPEERVRKARIAAIRRMLRASIPFTMRQRLVAELAELVERKS
jgi:hypothetical protein